MEHAPRQEYCDCVNLGVFMSFGRGIRHRDWKAKLTTCSWEHVQKALSSNKMLLTWLSHRQQSWVGWGVSGVAAYLGYVPSKDAPSHLPAPNESDILELYNELGFDPNDQADTRSGGSSISFNIAVHVSLASSSVFAALDCTHHA